MNRSPAGGGDARRSNRLHSTCNSDRFGMLEGAERDTGKPAHEPPSRSEPTTCLRPSGAGPRVETMV